LSKDPAFLFYDGDAARDVSHMNRLERGAYFDFIQAQRKFHGITEDQVKKILGKDFDNCWSSLELVLTKDVDDKYFIEWLRESIKKREIHAEKQRVRIQTYWDEQKNKKNIKKNKILTPKIPWNNHGDSNQDSKSIPLENENENIYINIIKNLNISNILWDEFKKHRIKIKKPMTHYAEERLLNKLSELKNKGYVPTDVINHMIDKGWQGIQESWLENSGFVRNESLIPSEDTFYCKICKKIKPIMSNKKHVCHDCE
jgi:hypothetical protein